MTRHTQARTHARMPHQRVAPVPTLSSGLAVATRDAHHRAQEAFALQDRLTGLTAYTALLRDLRGFYGPAERAIARAPGWDGLAPPVDVAARRRAHLLDDDLAALGVGAPAGPERECPIGRVGSLAQALGWLYVLEGSALGGQVVARAARRRLGTDLPVAFLTSASRADVAGDWVALRSTLDAFGQRGQQDADECVEGATRCFTLFATWLEREVVPA